MNFMFYGALENFSLLKKLKDLINSAALIWMFCRKTLYSKIETIHHRTLKVIYGIDDSYNNLLLCSNSVSIYQRHLRFLVTEICKSISQINPEFLWSFFKQKKLPYNPTI